MDRRGFLLIAVVFLLLVQQYECRRCGAPTLVAAAMAGLGVEDYDHEMHELDPSQKCDDLEGPFRTLDGTCNNVDNLGAANTRLKRLLPPVYDDGVESPRSRSSTGGPLRSARVISRRVLRDRRRRHNNTLLLMQWGQFLDHDMTLMPLPTERIQEEGGDPIVCCGQFLIGVARPLPEECFPITFQRDVDFAGSCMEFVRTIPAMKLDSADSNEPREQVNSITAFIDASSVYGSSLEEEEELRQSDGHGYLLKFEDSRQGPLLPRTERAICRSRIIDPDGKPPCFIAGDERVNEQPDLATIHTIFLRLHNLLAAEMARLTPSPPPSSLQSNIYFNETIFQSTRRVLGAIVQNVMYAEWLPVILGHGYMESFDLNVEDRSQYDPQVDPSILNEFSTAAYRMGHSLVPRSLPTPDPNPRKLRIPLRSHFLRPDVVRARLNALALGLVMANRTTAFSQAQAIDNFVSRELTEHLFEPNRRRRRGQDLVSLNIQRGRDHALQPYVRYREEFGLEPVTDFAHPATRQATNLKRVYRSVEDIDLFVGGLSEPPNMGGGQLGDTFSFILAEQMKRLKFGDRFFFTHDEPVGFTDRQLRQLRNVTSAKVMCLTVEPITEMQLDAFVQRGPNNPTVPCDDLVGDLARDFLDLRDFVVEP